MSLVPSATKIMPAAVTPTPSDLMSINQAADTLSGELVRLLGLEMFTPGREVLIELYSQDCQDEGNPKFWTEIEGIREIRQNLETGETRVTIVIKNKFFFHADWYWIECVIPKVGKTISSGVIVSWNARGMYPSREKNPTDHREAIKRIVSFGFR